MQQSRARAVIFDMDGVLFSSGQSHEKAFTEALGEVSFGPFSYAEVAGMRTDEAFKKLYRERNRSLSEEDLARLVASKQRKARALLATESRLMDGADQLLNSLSMQHRLALASSASKPTVDIFLSKLSRPEVFEFCIDGSAVERAKPAPDIYTEAVRRLGLVPSQCLVIEDAVNGVMAATAAGIRTIAIAGTDEPEKLLAAGAECVVTSLQELQLLLMI